MKLFFWGRNASLKSIPGLKLALEPALNPIELAACC
jgi:hypothetical protein